MSTYTVTAERGRRRWVLQCVEYPGALSEVARLDQAEEAAREAIAFVAGVAESSVHIDLRTQLPEAPRGLSNPAQQCPGRALRGPIDPS